MKTHTLILFILLGLSWTIQAQNELHFSHVGRENGLPLDKANCITQDGNGFIWIGTWNGLAKFDGYNCTNFLPQYRDSSSISNREITCLLTDVDGDVWAGTSNGLNHIQIKTNQIQSFPFSSRITSLFQDANYSIWVGTLGDGLYKLDRKTRKTVSYLDEETVNVIYEDRYENLWVGTNSGLYFIDRIDGKHKKYAYKSYGNSISNSTIMQVISSENGYLWIATWGGGLNRAELDRNGMLRNFTAYLPESNSQGICSDVVYRLKCDKDNNLWIGSRNNGLSLLKADQQSLSAKDAVFQTYQNEPLNPNSISSNNISCLYIDNDNNLWIGANKVDRAQIADEGIERYALPKATDSKSLNIKCFAKHNNKLWVGANQYIFEYEKVNNSYQFVKEHNPAKHISPKHLYTTHNILSMYASNDGLWVGTEGGGILYYPFRNQELYLWGARLYNKRTHITIPENRITSIIPSRTEQNTIWIGTEYGGIARLKTNNKGVISTKTYNISNGLSCNSIRALLEDEHGDIWMGTRTGLNHLQTKTESISSYFYEANDTLSINDNIINSIFEDSNNNIWVSTNSGLNKKIEHNGEVAFLGYPKLDYLSNELVFNIEEDNEKNLWIRMYNGILKFNLNSETVTDKFSSHDLENTFLARNSNLVIDNQAFLVGNNANFICFNPQVIKNKQDSSNVSITDVQVFNQSVIYNSTNKHDNDQLKLSYKDKMITISFSDMSFSAPQEVIYYYKLEGFDRQWNKAKGKNIATYTNLPSGDYDFHVCTGDTILHANSYKFTLTISTPWWKSLFAYFLYILALVGYSYAYIIYRKNKEAEKHQLALEKVKAVELERLNEQKSLFFTDITHELRTPLTLILEPVKELESEHHLKAHTKEKIRLIRTSADKLMRLVNKIMEFRKLENNSSAQLIYTLVDLNQMLQEIYTYFTPLAHARKIKFSIDCENESVNTYIDLDKFEKVVFNLISNAFKYTANGGNVSIKIAQEKDHAWLHITDNGIGIASEYQEKIFERFFQINQIRTQSTGGVGLYMVKELVDQHQGTIELQSEVDKGSTFTVSIPLKPSNVGELNNTLKTYNLIENSAISFHDEKVQVEDDFNGHKMLQVLVVEDDIELNKFIASELSKSFHVQTAMNGKEALDMLNQSKADLILSDILMPEMGGFELAKTLAKDKQFAHIPIIFLTAKDSIAEETKGLKLGAIDYITKPFDMDSLMLKIKNILSARQKNKKEARTKQLLEPEKIKLPSGDEQFLTKAVQMIQKSIDNTEYDVERFSDDMKMSQNQLYRRLKKLTGQTAKEFIRNQRLKVAADLLANQGRTPSEVIHMTGFSSLSYFSRCFKTAYGCSPTEYTQRNN